jgi:hypothetical protein
MDHMTERFATGTKKKFHRDRKRNQGLVRGEQKQKAMNRKYRSLTWGPENERNNWAALRQGPEMEGH